MFFSRRSGHKHIDTGDISGMDWTKDSFTIDGSYHILELPARVPNNAKFVTLRGTIRSTVAGKYLNFREYGNVNGFNSQYMYTQAVSRTKDLPFPDIPVNQHKIEYRVLGPAGDWDFLSFVVINWKV